MLSAALPLPRPTTYLVHVLDIFERDTVLDVLGEVFLVLGLVFLGQVLHVLCDVRTVDAVAVQLRLQIKSGAAACGRSSNTAQVKTDELG